MFLSVKNLNVSYTKAPVLWDVTLEIPRNLKVALIGPNGAGKSTFIKALLNLVQPLSGEVSFFGKSFEEAREEIAYVPQKEAVDWDFPITLFELVLMGTYAKMGLFRFVSKREKEKARHYLQLLGLSDFAHRQINELSGGQKQRAFLARALCQEASIYFLDEPFTGIDMASTEVILDLLEKMKSEGKSLFVVHHDLEKVASFFDYAVLLNTYLVAHGKVEDVLDEKWLKIAYGDRASLLEKATKLIPEKEKGLLP